MKGDPQATAALNDYLSCELAGHRQYLLHAAACRHAGFERLARIQAAYSAEETAHASQLAARILLLGGTPAPREFAPFVVEPTVPGQLARDRQLVGAAIGLLREAIEDCEKVRDFATRRLLAEMLADEELHLDWLETELALVDTLGLERYLQAQLE